MLSQKGQSVEEVIGIVVVILVFFVLVLVVVLQRNSETEMIAKIAENTIQCNAVSETIVDLFNNRAKSEQVLFIKKPIAIKPNVIFVDDNSISCTYNGIAKDSAGLHEFSLSAQQQYRFWKGNGEVIVCAMPC